jgi:hypothetical protein
MCAICCDEVLDDDAFAEVANARHARMKDSTSRLSNWSLFGWLIDWLRVAMVSAVAGMGCLRAYVFCFVLSVLVRWAGVWEVRATSITGGSVARGPHISNLNVLLPPRSSRPVHYHLQGYNGCFTWFGSMTLSFSLSLSLSLSPLVWDLAWSAPLSLATFAICELDTYVVRLVLVKTAARNYVCSCRPAIHD